MDKIKLCSRETTIGKAVRLVGESIGIVPRRHLFSGHSAEEWISPQLALVKDIIGTENFDKGIITHIKTNRGHATVFDYTTHEESDNVHTAAIAFEGNGQSITYPPGVPKSGSDLTFFNDQGKTTAVKDGYPVRGQNGSPTFVFLAHDRHEAYEPRGVFLWISPQTQIVEGSAKEVAINDLSQFNLPKQPSL